MDESQGGARDRIYEKCMCGAAKCTGKSSLVFNGDRTLIVKFCDAGVMFR